MDVRFLRDGPGAKPCVAGRNYGAPRVFRRVPASGAHYFRPNAGSFGSVGEGPFGYGTRWILVTTPTSISSKNMFDFSLLVFYKIYVSLLEICVLFQPALC